VEFGILEQVVEKVGWKELSRTLVGPQDSLNYQYYEQQGSWNPESTIRDWRKVLEGPGIWRRTH